MKILDLTKSLIFNLKVFSLKDALKMPILINHKTKFNKVKKNSIIIEDNIKFGMIRIGFGGSEGIQSSKGETIKISTKGKIIFKGRAELGVGASIRVEDEGILTIGRNVSANKNIFISCAQDISIGEDVIIGYNVNIRDSDGHDIFDIETNIKNESKKSVIINDNVWIAAYVDILKGSYVDKNSIVAYRSCLLSEIKEENCIIGGYPAKILRKNIVWKK